MIQYEKIMHSSSMNTSDALSFLVTMSGEDMVTKDFLVVLLYIF